MFLSVAFLLAMVVIDGGSALMCYMAYIFLFLNSLECLLSSCSVCFFKTFTDPSNIETCQ